MKNYLNYYCYNKIYSNPKLLLLYRGTLYSITKQLKIKPKTKLYKRLQFLIKILIIFKNAK